MSPAAAPSAAAPAAAPSAASPSAPAPSYSFGAAPAPARHDVSGEPRVFSLKKRAKPKIKPYDFKRPDKFSKDQIRTLQMIHETFARFVTTSLSAQLRALVHVHVASVDQLTYEEFVKSLPNPSTLAIVEMQPLEGSSVFEIDPSIVFTIIDRILGGKGYSTNLSRELTDIEISVMERIVQKILASLRESWSNVVDLKPKLEKIEANPQFVQIVPPNDMVVLVTLETKVSEVEGMINLCIPYIVLEPIVNKLSAQFWYSSIRKRSTEEQVENLKARIGEIYVPVNVEVGRTILTVGELLNLRRGDVVKLDAHADRPFIMKIRDKLKYFCIPGVHKMKLSTKITSKIEDMDKIREQGDMADA
ncbi:flagellar motor switch protein FliM [bacterium]|nr:flagellar motor switch protein FliM [bacterium]